jgi:hypothetical protein
MRGGRKAMLWRPCNFAPIHSLTGPVGQPFASCQGGSAVHLLRMHKLTNGTGFLVLALSCYSGDPDVIRSLALAPLIGCFTRLCADNVKSPHQVTRGSPVEALKFHSNTQSHWSSGPTVCLLSRGSAVCILGMHKLTMEPGFSC